MVKLGLGLLLVSAAGAVGAQNMLAATFLAKAEALEKKGAMALFSGDLGVLKREIQASGKLLRAEQQAAAKTGRKAAYCMPEKAGINSSELLAHLRALPPAERNQPIRAAFAGLVRKKYPCPT